MTVFEKIEAQQKGIENSPAWMVGEQLKDICAADPHCADLVDKDLNDKSMSLQAAAGKIKAWADKQKRVGNCVCVPPNKAEEIIRKFYGLPEAAPKAPFKIVESQSPAKEEEAFDLFSMF